MHTFTATKDNVSGLMIQHSDKPAHAVTTPATTVTQLSSFIPVPEQPITPTTTITPEQKPKYAKTETSTSTHLINYTDAWAQVTPRTTEPIILDKHSTYKVTMKPHLIDSISSSIVPTPQAPTTKPQYQSIAQQTDSLNLTDAHVNVLTEHVDTITTTQTVPKCLITAHTNMVLQKKTVEDQPVSMPSQVDRMTDQIATQIKPPETTPQRGLEDSTQTTVTTSPLVDQTVISKQQPSQSVGVQACTTTMPLVEAAHHVLLETTSQTAQATPPPVEIPHTPTKQDIETQTTETIELITTPIQTEQQPMRDQHISVLTERGEKTTTTKAIPQCLITSHSNMIVEKKTVEDQLVSMPSQVDRMTDQIATQIKPPETTPQRGLDDSTQTTTTFSPLIEQIVVSKQAAPEPKIIEQCSACGKRSILTKEAVSITETHTVDGATQPQTKSMVSVGQQCTPSLQPKTTSVDS